MNNTTFKFSNYNLNNYSSLEFILVELAKRMINRLDYIKFSPTVILECGSGLGYDSIELEKRFKTSKIIGIDYWHKLLKANCYAPKTGFKRIFSQSKIQLVTGLAEKLPIKNKSIDLYYANMLIPYLTNIKPMLKEINRILKLNGLFLISGLGVDSLKELRELGLNTFKFHDLHDIGDLLLNTGFTNPVVDSERLSIVYDNIEELITDLRILGAKPTKNHLSKNQYAKLKTLKNINLSLEIFIAYGIKGNEYLDLVPGEKIIQFNPQTKI